MKTLLINGNKVIIEKVHRTKTQYEYYLTIFMGDSEVESILSYQELHLTFKSAKKEAVKVITTARKPFFLKETFKNKKI